MPALNQQQKQNVLFCGISLGIGIGLGFLAGKWSRINRKIDEKMFDYIMKVGNREIPELQKIQDITIKKHGKRAGMITSIDQLYWFKWLMSTMKIQKAIEIGVFTGSSALCIAQGMPDNGRLMAFDVSKEYTDIAKKMWKKAGVDHKIKMSLDGGIGGLDALGRNKKELGTYDFAYIDAIKTEYFEYYQKILPLMRKGGVIAFDNVLWKGRVADKKNTDVSTLALRELNLKIKNDDRVNMCIVTMGDERMATRHSIAVHGYIRENFDENCWIYEIMDIVMQYYINKCGSLYVFGDGKDGCLGMAKYYRKQCKTPTLCTPFDQNNVLQVEAAAYHTMILDIDGNVWSCGRGESVKSGDRSVKVATKLKIHIPVTSVSAGVNHSLVLLQNGWVRSFGSNEYGQLGHCDLAQSLVPKTIEMLIPFKVMQLAAGNYYSTVLTEDGDLYCFGSNYYGQCGIGNGKGGKIMTPTKVELNEKIVFIDCGTSHSLIITHNHLIYSCGDGFDGKLGHGDTDHKRSATVIDTLKQKRIQISAGGWKHSLCVDDEGIVYAFGLNQDGQCGLSSHIVQQSTPKVIDYFVSNNIKAKDIAAGANISSVISEDGSLYVFGDNIKCPMDVSSCYTPTVLSLPPAQKVSMGYYHTAVICNTV